jgi:hypothetical protein
MFFPFSPGRIYQTVLASLPWSISTPSFPLLATIFNVHFALHIYGVVAKQVHLFGTDISLLRYVSYRLQNVSAGGEWV